MRSSGDDLAEIRRNANLKEIGSEVKMVRKL